MLKLKSLKIHKYRNVRPGACLRFSDGHNILLGRNGTGKTTLLNLLTNLFSQSLADLSREELSVELELAFPGGQLSAALSVTPADVSLAHGDDELAERPLQIHVRAVARLDGSPEEARVEADGGGLRYIGGDQVETFDLDRSNFGFADVLGDALIHMSNNLATRHQEADLAAHTLRELPDLLRFDESLRVLETQYLKSPLMYLRVVGTKGRSVSNLGHLPNEVEGLLNDSFQLDQNLTEFVVGHADLGALSEVVRILEFSGAQLRVSLLEKQVKSPRLTEYLFGNPRYLFTQRNGSITPLEHLSYGQKRLLAFFLYLGANRHMLIADELVNGLHHEWIDECVRAMGDRQTFLTSQNPLLLDYLAFASPEDVKQTFVLCRLVREGDEDVLEWGNISQDEAAMVFDAFQVGLQQVGEILRTRGLW